MLLVVLATVAATSVAFAQGGSTRKGFTRPKAPVNAPAPFLTEAVDHDIDSGVAVRGDPTPEEEAEMAKAIKMMQEKARAASSCEPRTLSVEPVAGAEPPPREQRTSRIDDLPLAGLDASTRSLNRTGLVVTFNRNADAISPEANEKLTNALKLAAAAENQGNFVAASEHYRSALELKPDSTIALQGQAEARDRLGQLEASLKHYQRIQTISPTASGVALKMAQLHVGLGDLPRAEKEAERAVLAAPNSGLAMSWLGTVELLQGERDMAETSFRRAMQREPRVVEQRYQTALQLLDTGQARRAATEAVSVLTMKPDHAGALFVAAEAYVELGSRERAVAYFQRYLELDAAGAYAARARRRLQELGAR